MYVKEKNTMAYDILLKGIKKAAAEREIFLISYQSNISNDVINIFSFSLFPLDIFFYSLYIIHRFKMPRYAPHPFHSFFTAEPTCDGCACVCMCVIEGCCSLTLIKNNFYTLIFSIYF